MYQAMTLPVFKGVWYFLPQSVPWNLLPSVCLQDQDGDLVVEVFLEYGHPPPADTRAHPEPRGERERGELGFAGGCSAFLEEVEMDNLNGELALQNQKRFCEQSCMSYK